ncbi:hypothetical protein B0I35DRAFT_429565 [Stachybotrys elegans]|uniref:Uncharacterized protein n=1 Tax=Stachybotrys elegans TaxID=80388 RepID=A0A8K0SPZ2_9HYPO|nr:hypothetical protein B0I35DRAFT_429565 [Stachybotrys elegans]
MVISMLSDLRELDPGHPSTSPDGDGGTCPHPLLPVVNGAPNAILPCAAKMADTATTISNPKTSFASVSPIDMQVHTKFRGGPLSTTTVVSRRSVAKITWAENHTINPYAHTHSLPGVYGTEAYLTGFSVHHRTTAENLESLVADISRAQNRVHWAQSDSTITSFPAFHTRRYTSAWLNPPMPTEASSHHSAHSLYKHDVDAHSGNVSRSAATYSDEPLKPRQYNDSLFNSDRLFDERGHSRNPTHGLSASHKAEQRLGASLGTASHRRRSVQVQDRKPSDEPQNSIVPEIMEKIRRRSQRFLRHYTLPQRTEDSVLPLDSPEVTDAPDPLLTPGGEDTSITSLRSRDSLVRERTLEPPRIDRAGIYEAMTGSRLISGRLRKNTCSEDNAPHECADDMSMADSFLS